MTKPRHCGECGSRNISRRNVKNILSIPWKDYPVAFVTCDLELWYCDDCRNTPYEGGDPGRVDEAAELSVCDQAGQFIDIIKSKSGLPMSTIASRIGVSAEYLSGVRSGKRTPSFTIWNFLKVLAMDPTETLKRLDPLVDPFKANLLLHA